ncbi:MAG: hypothetical protein HY869_17045 [Chloroflexi bacterium]|nr:hypothetical protein [Chloroflexota bacterium]
MLPPLDSPQNGECQGSAGTAALNLYAIEPEDWVLDVYNYSRLADEQSTPGRKFREARHAAFRILGKQVHRWSDFVDFKLSEADVVRITITYLSPQLIEAILLNEALYKGVPTAPEVFKTSLLEGLARTGSRAEILFLITITSTRYTTGPNGEPPISIDIPFKSLSLTNSTGVSASAKRFDQSITQLIQLTHGPVAGVFGYQMTVGNEVNCSLLLDPNVNNTISIHLDDLSVNGQGRGPQTWTIRYESLLGENGVGMKPQYLEPSQPIDNWKPSSNTPRPQITVPSTVDGYWDSYWEQMACYIWEQVTFANSP